VPSDGTLLAFIEMIAHGDRAAARLLHDDPALATARLERDEERFLDEIKHQLYAGDTALHVAAGAYDAAFARTLVAGGAVVAAVNRRGAQPLHYATQGEPDGRRWNPVAQRATIATLVELGADPDAKDKTGTTPLLRAVRNRCAAAVDALLAAGADPRATNRNGSTALELAGWTTGRGGTGLQEAKTQQAEIVRLLQSAGAR
jgi:hypothetical protein